jgi:hypothetical protein
LLLVTASFLCHVNVLAQIQNSTTRYESVQQATNKTRAASLLRKRQISGIDPIYAMKEAIKFVESFLEKPNQGQAFFWPDGEEY